MFRCSHLNFPLIHAYSCLGDDPGLVYQAFVAHDYAPDRDFRDYWPQSGEKYVSDNVWEHLVAPRNGYKIAGAVHQGLKGRIAAGRRDLRWRRRTGANRIFDAKYKIFRQLDADGSIGCFSMAPSDTLSFLTALDRLPAGRVMQMLDRITGSSEGASLSEQEARACPVYSYRFGKRFKMARDNRRERFIRRRHIDITAHAIIGRRRKRRYKRLSRKKQIRERASMMMRKQGTLS